MTPSVLKLTVILETDDLIVVDKPENISSIPEREEKDNDLSYLISRHVGKRVLPVFLLDKSVSGLILFAKNQATHEFLNAQFTEGKMEHTFMALLHGETKAKKATVNAPLKKFGSGRMGVSPAGFTGQDAITDYDVVERFTTHTLVRITPRTNRRHQIRVHMFSIGHPIVGDQLYGDPKIQKPYPHLLLHSHELEFEPAPGKKENLTTPMPWYFGEVKKKLIH